MSEEIIDDNVPMDPVDKHADKPADNPPEAAETPYEAAARSEGWKSKEELGDAYDPVRYVNAEEFIKRKPLFETIKQQSKSIKELKKTVESVVHFSKQNAEIAARNAIAQLKAQKKEAISIGDADAVELIDNSIKVQEQAAQNAAQTVVSIPAEITEWAEKNKWFDLDMELQDFFTTFCASYAKRNPGQPIEMALQSAEAATRRAFPDSKYFAPSRRPAAPMVEPQKGESAKSSAKYSTSRLTDDQRRTYDAYVRKSKILTHEQYFQKLEEIGALAK